MIELLKKFKGYIALIASFIAIGGGLFHKIDAYAEDKVNEGVEKLKGQTDRKLDKIHAHLDVVDEKLVAAKEQAQRMEDKQDKMIDMLLDAKHGRK